MGKFTISVKVNVILDIECEAQSLEDAIKAGRSLKWNTLLSNESTVQDGKHEVVGVSNSEAWDI